MLYLYVTITTNNEICICLMKNIDIYFIAYAIKKWVNECHFAVGTTVGY